MQRSQIQACIPGIPTKAAPAKLVFSVLVVLLTLAPLAATQDAFAGPNYGGYLILHCNQSLQFTTDGDFNGYAELSAGKDAVTQVPGNEQGVVYFVLAAFDDFAMPRIKAITFGIELSDPRVIPQRYGPSGYDPFELSDDRWPASGTGTTISWTEPLDRRTNEVYWMCGYAYSGQTVKLVEHPRQGGVMVDDQVPGEVDQIAGYGTLGFGVKGFNPFGEVATGACCSGTGQCILQTQVGCQSFAGYNYRGDWSLCSPNPCTPGAGACCIVAECHMLSWDDCIDARGLFQGEGIGCEPTPCDFRRVDTTWGALKSTYSHW